MYLPLVQRSRCVPINSLSTTDLLEGWGHPRPPVGMMCPTFLTSLSSAAGALHKPPTIIKLPGQPLLRKQFSHLSFSVFSACSYTAFRSLVTGQTEPIIQGAFMLRESFFPETSEGQLRGKVILFVPGWCSWKVSSRQMEILSVSHTQDLTDLLGKSLWRSQDSRQASDSPIGQGWQWPHSRVTLIFYSPQRQDRSSATCKQLASLETFKGNFQTDGIRHSSWCLSGHHHASLTAPVPCFWPSQVWKCLHSPVTTIHYNLISSVTISPQAGLGDWPISGTPISHGLRPAKVY